LTSATLPPRRFDFCFIDEAGQATEPDILIPISRCVKSGHVTPQIVLAGDPEQLGPVVKSPYSRYFGLGLSLLDRLMKNDKNYKRNESNGNYCNYYVIKLLYNYRTVESILKITSALFYHSELLVPPLPDQPRLNIKNQTTDQTLISSEIQSLFNKPKVPIIFDNMEPGGEQRHSNSFSWFNPKEIIKIMFYLRKINNYKNIGIITPYKAQVKVINIT